MLNVTLTDRNGNTQEINCTPGQSLLDAIQEAGLYDLQALCGGSCSCATCHVYVSPDADDNHTLTNDDEDALLDGSNYRLPSSRLACQVIIDDDFNGRQILIAPEE